MYCLMHAVGRTIIKLNAVVLYLRLIILFMLLNISVDRHMQNLHESLAKQNEGLFGAT